MSFLIAILLSLSVFINDPVSVKDMSPNFVGDDDEFEPMNGLAPNRMNAADGSEWPWQGGWFR